MDEGVAMVVIDKKEYISKEFNLLEPKTNIKLINLAGK